MPTPLKLDRVVHSKHYRERTEPIKYIILHCYAGTPQEQLERMDNLGVSVHYIIGRDNTTTEVLPPSLVAYHAGASRWQNSEGKSLNDCSIGIEIETKTLGQSPTDYQVGVMKKLYSLLTVLCLKYKIRRENILGHSDIAPTRKPDPGAGFPWKKLYQYNLGIWYNLRCLDKETDESKLLQNIGYDTTSLIAARYAFCRRYLPEEIFVEEDIHKLLETPYPADFTPQNAAKYMRLLRAVSFSFTEERRKSYWYLEK